MEPEMLDALIRDIKARIEALTEQLTRNQCDTLGDYKFVAGGIKELMMILQNHEEYEKKFLED